MLPAKTKETFAIKSASIHWNTVVCALLIVAAGLWIYWPALFGTGLQLDDNVLVTDNARLHSLHGLWQIWFSTPTTDYWPLTWSLLWMGWHLWGNAPLGYHVCSLVLHILSGFLIWKLFNRLGMRWPWLGGLLFVIHPLAVDSVAWLAEIKNTLSLPFFLLSFDAWMDAEEKQSSDHSRSILYYLAAMLSKSSAVMLPLVILLYCWWKRGHIKRQEFKGVIPYFAIAVTLGAITIYFQNHGHSYPVEIGGFFTRFVRAGTVLFFYLYKFILPIDLMPFYPRWNLDPHSLLKLLALPIFGSLLLGLWIRRRGWGRHALFGFGFFVLNLLPVLGLVKMRWLDISWVGDHLVYLPMIGLVGLIVAGVGQLPERLSWSPYLFGIGTMSLVVATGFLLWESRNYASLFNNPEKFWTYAVQNNPHTCVTHNGLGVALLQKGRLFDAIEQFEQALKIQQRCFPAHNNLGVAFMKTGRPVDAIEQFEQALKIKSDYTTAQQNLAKAHELLKTSPTKH